MDNLTRELVLVVYGLPAPKGSMKCVGQKGRHQLVENSTRTKPWREKVAHAAAKAYGATGYTQALGVEVTLTVDRPTNHYRVDGKTLSKAGERQPWPSKRSIGIGGDVDKLARVILDALDDAGLYVDDSQVVELTTRKTYRDGPGVLPDALNHPGARIRIYPIGEGE